MAERGQFVNIPFSTVPIQSTARQFSSHAICAWRREKYIPHVFHCQHSRADGLVKRLLCPGRLISWPGITKRFKCGSQGENQGSMRSFSFLFLQWMWGWTCSKEKLFACQHWPLVTKETVREWIAQNEPCHSRREQQPWLCPFGVRKRHTRCNKVHTAFYMLENNLPLPSAQML